MRASAHLGNHSDVGARSSENRATGKKAEGLLCSRRVEATWDGQEQAGTGSRNRQEGWGKWVESTSSCLGRRLVGTSSTSEFLKTGIWLECSGSSAWLGAPDLCCPCHDAPSTGASPSRRDQCIADPS
ncbi:hypothetical protein LIA77_07291 [Sarocladium implicatum]|nr:hypothetical protein LIA77_07291 [Sarocladium implicatum]